MIRHVLIALIVLMATPVRAQTTPDQFDLICTGSQSRTENGETSSIPFNVRYSINLTTGFIRTAQTNSTIQIERVEEYRLVLVDAGNFTMTIDRLTGHLRSVARYSTGVVHVMDAQCERSEFTPFEPNRRF